MTICGINFATSTKISGSVSERAPIIIDTELTTVSSSAGISLKIDDMIDGTSCATTSIAVGNILFTVPSSVSIIPPIPADKESAAPAEPSSAPLSPSPINLTKGVIDTSKSAESVLSVVKIGSAIAPSSFNASLNFA